MWKDLTKWRALFLALALVAIVVVWVVARPSRPQPSKGSLTTRIVDVPPTGIELGWGWDSLREGPVPNLCIEFVEAVEYGQDSMVTADEVTDKSELLDRLDVSAAASVQGIGPVSGSVKVEFAEQSKVNSFHSTFVLEARVDNGVKFIAPAPTTRRGRFEAKQAQASQYIRRAPFPEGGVRLTEAARSLAAKGDKAFRFVCGDSFVSAIYEGARLYATITLKDSSREKQERWAASMSAEGWGAGISGSGLSATEKKDLSAKMAVTVLQTGGSGGELSMDKEGIARMLKALPEGALRGPKFNRIALTSYDELPDWPAGPLVSDQTELEQVVSYWGAYSTLYDDIDFVLSNRDHFSFEILSASYFKTLEGLQDDLLRKIEDITIVAKKCSDQGGLCEFSEEAFPHPYDYRIWLPLPTELTPAKPPFREWRQDWRRQLYYQDYRGRVVDYHVRRRVRKKCLANKAAFGCIPNAEIDRYEVEVVALYTEGAEWIRNDYPVAAFHERQLKNGQDCLTADDQGRLTISACIASPEKPTGEVQRFSLNVVRHLTARGLCAERQTEGQPHRVMLRACGPKDGQAWVFTHRGFLRSGDLCFTRQADNIVALEACRNDHAEFPEPVASQRWSISD